jgi:hypothetical protein
MKRSDSNWIISTVLAVVFSATTLSAQELTKTFSWKNKINPDAKVSIDNYDCNLTIHTWDKGESEFRLTLEGEAKSAEDATVLQNYIQGLVFSTSPSSASYKTSFWVSRTTVMNRTTMKLEGGKSVILKSFSLKGELWIPAGCNLALDSKYSSVSLEDFSGPLKLELYNDNLSAGKVSSRIYLNDKYSTIVFHDIKDLHANLYNSKLTAGNSDDIVIETKYSEVNLASCGNITVNSYNDKYDVRKTGDVVFTAKYSDLKSEISGNATIDLYNGTVKIGEAKDVKITSKYGEYQFSKAGRLTMPSLYNDKLSLGKITSIKIDESKYTSLNIENLAVSAEDLNGYNDSFNISDLGKDFKGLSLTGKYLQVYVALPRNLNYRLKTDIKYADLKMNESELKPIEKIIDGDNTKIEAVRGTESDGMPVVEVKGYQITMKLTDK